MKTSLYIVLAINPSFSYFCFLLPFIHFIHTLLSRCWLVMPKYGIVLCPSDMLAGFTLGKNVEEMEILIIHKNIFVACHHI